MAAVILHLPFPVPFPPKQVLKMPEASSRTTMLFFHLSARKRKRIIHFFPKKRRFLNKKNT